MAPCSVFCVLTFLNKTERPNVLFELSMMSFHVFSSKILCLLPFGSRIFVLPPTSLTVAPQILFVCQFPIINFFFATNLAMIIFVCLGVYAFQTSPSLPKINFLHVCAMCLSWLFLITKDVGVSMLRLNGSLYLVMSFLWTYFPLRFRSYYSRSYFFSFSSWSGGNRHSYFPLSIGNKMQRNVALMSLSHRS